MCRYSRQPLHVHCLQNEVGLLLGMVSKTKHLIPKLLLICALLEYNVHANHRFYHKYQVIDTSWKVYRKIQNKETHIANHVVSFVQ